MGRSNPMGEVRAERASFFCGHVVRHGLLTTTVALYVARPLLPSEAVAQRGSGVVFVMLWLSLATLWALREAMGGRLYLRFGKTDTALLVFLSLYTASALLAIGQGSPRPAINMLWEGVAMGLAFFLVRQLVQTSVERKAVLIVLIGVATAISALAFFQYFYGAERDRAIYKRCKEDPAEMLQLVGEWYPPGSVARQQFENRLYSVEPNATFALTNSLAGFLVPWLVMVLGIGLSRPVGSTVVPPHFWRMVLCAVPIAGSVLLTKSRTAYLAVAVGMVLLWRVCCPGEGLSRRKMIWGIIAVMVVMLCLVVLAGGVDQEILTEAKKSLDYRLQYWQATLSIIADHPWLGCGPGQYQDIYTAYKLPEASEEIQDPHNMFLEIWSTSGTPTLIALLVAVGFFVSRIFGDDSTRDLTEEPTWVPTPGAENPRFILMGGLVGAVLAWPAGFSIGLPPSVEVVPVTLCLLGLSWWLYQRWITVGILPRELVTVGVTVAVVNLLAAGGIGFPAVANTLWLLVALRINSSPWGTTVRVLPKHAAWAVCLILATMTVLFYGTGYRPVLLCGNLLRRASSPSALKNDAVRRRALQQAVLADPRSVEAVRLTTAQYLQRFQREQSSDAQRAFDDQAEKLEGLARQSSLTWSQLGQWYAQAYQQSKDIGYLQQAVRAQQRAVVLYPNSTLQRALLAEFFSLAGREGDAVEEATEALRLDEIIQRAGHHDKSLGSSGRRTMQELVRGKN